MSPNTELLTQLNWRYATKRFDPSKRIPDSEWRILEESLRLSPSSYGLQPWQFWVIKNPTVKQTLRTLSWNQSQVEECSHFVVITTLKSMSTDYVDAYIQKTAEERQIPVESLETYKGMMVGDLVNGPRSHALQAWAQRQAYIAMGTVMTAAALLKIDSCPLEGLQPSEYDKVLGLDNTNYATVAAIAFGYRHAEDGYQHAKKVRFDRDTVIKTLE